MVSTLAGVVAIAVLAIALVLWFSRKAKAPKKECKIKVIDWPEKNNDNQDFEKKHPDALKAGSKKEMVEKVLKKVKKEKCCIRKLVLLGHGAPGNISVGAGRESIKCKEIDGKKDEWEKILKDLKGKFCKDAEIILFGCEVGRCEKGAKKLSELADFFGVKVRAPTKEVYGDGDPQKESDQVANPGKKPVAKGCKEKPGGKLKKKARTSISLPSPDDVEAMAIYACTREFWANPPETIEYAIRDPETIASLLGGVDYSNEYEGAGLKARYSSKVFILKRDQTTLSFHLLLDWKAAELMEGDVRSIFILRPETSELFRELAVRLG